MFVITAGGAITPISVPVPIPLNYVFIFILILVSGRSGARRILPVDLTEEITILNKNEILNKLLFK